MITARRMIQEARKLKIVLPACPELVTRHLSNPNTSGFNELVEGTEKQRRTQAAIAEGERLLCQRGGIEHAALLKRAMIAAACAGSSCTYESHTKILGPFFTRYRPRPLNRAG